MPDTITTNYEELRKLYKESAHLLNEADKLAFFDNQLTICEQYQKYQQLNKELSKPMKKLNQEQRSQLYFDRTMPTEMTKTEKILFWTLATLTVACLLGAGYAMYLAASGQLWIK